jgi:TonB-dependent starch-binding outer membrane protein SusC
MRISLFLMLVCVFNTFAGEGYSQTAKVSVNLHGAKVEDVLNNIEEQSEFYFLFNQKLVDVTRTVDIEAHDVPIKDILSGLFASTDVAFTVIDRQIVLTNKETADKIEEIQQLTITGTVTDAEKAQPMPGVTVRVNGTTQGTTTDVNGKYSIQLKDGSSVLIFSFIGYETQEITVGAQSVIDVTLNEDVTSLEEIVVVGYGVQKKSVVTGSISSVSSDDLNNASITRPEQALQGKTAGVQVTSISGSPGSNMKVRVRGYSSNNEAEPLYIVDGVKTSNISNLDPNDINSMEVLKDAASAAIYGAEGGNGVVIITTKNGKSGTHSINYSFQYMMQKHGKIPEVLNAQEYANYYNEAGVFTISENDMLYDTDWLSKVFESAPVLKHHVSFESGNETSHVLISASSLNQEGIVVGDKDKYKRYTIRMNADTRITKWLKVGNNASFSISQRKALMEDTDSKSVLAGALRLDPLTPVYYENNAIPDHVQALLDGGKKLVKDENGHYYGVSKYLTKDPPNPFTNIAVTNGVTKDYQLQGSFFADFTPIKNVTYTSRLGYEYLTSNASSWVPVYFYNGNSNYNDISTVREGYNLSTYWIWENFATYNNKFGSHNITAMIGMSAESRSFKNTIASGGPMILEDPNFAHLSFITGQSNDNISGQEFINNKASYFGRISYDYKNKYMLMMTARRDGAGSSLLPKENRWGIFPSVSLGWAFTEESFFPKGIIDFGKLRFSWGKNGSLSNLNNYMYASTITSSLLYQLSDLTYHTASMPNRLNNPELRWEASVQTDIGLDLRMFNSKLNFTADYFNKKTTDLITTNTPPAAAGNTSPSVNGGDVLNKGVEFELRYRGSLGDFNYSIGGNLAYLKNSVTYLNPTIDRIEGFYQGLNVINTFEQGYPVWYFRGYKTDGINEATGDLNFVDVKPDGIINSDDKTMIGSPIPDYTFGGGIDLSYKGFDFLVNLQGQAGNEIFVALIRNDSPGGNYPKSAYDGRWTPEKPTGATMPKAGGITTTALSSDLFIYKGNYARIKQLQLGYTLPESLISKISMKSLRLYVSLEDFFTFTNYPFMDPEIGTTSNQSTGTDRGQYPIMKKALFGLSVSF